MIFSTSELTSQQNYRLLNGGVTPRPIAWISTRSADGVDNIAPYSFFSVASCQPPVLMYTQILPRNGKDKDTLTNLKQTGQCIVNIVNEALLEQANLTSAALEAAGSEFDYANIEVCPGTSVDVLAVKASPIRYECTLRDIITVSEQPTGGSVVLLNVESVYVRDDLYHHDLIDQSQTQAVGKLGGDDYAIAPHIVSLTRP
ncbi:MULTISPECIES: flavin reductase family protein [unclassified Vibrio]|uniref:Flavin reductase family protein n=1 Tax=Vibrio sp. HB236076 TaxID=3232307 RepID=A0AB39HCC1_9VIBR|nr:flavin reductase family protein [Vibrio sp. HB161653]MDP5253799.1 flavin reductase family protein [Vibrio sp. HB161653]